MDTEGITYLIYDKCIGTNHTFFNEQTQQYTVEKIMSAPGTEYLIGHHAVEFSKNFFDAQTALPDNLDKELYSIHIFKMTIEGSSELGVFTIIGINNKKLLNIISKQPSDNSPIDIPNKHFLVTLCRFHINYNNCTQNKKKACGDDIAITDSVQQIIKTVMDKTNHIVDPIIENPKCITTELFGYQKKSINWMRDKEVTSKKIVFNLNSEIAFGDVYFDLNRQTFNTTNDRKTLTFYGGCLIDEVGLGKTVQMTALSLLNVLRDKDTKYINDKIDPIRFISRATLILCPNQLCGQWKRELTKMISKEHDPKIISLLTKVHYDKFTYEDLCNADFVLVSYSFLDNQNFLKTWLSKVSTIKSYHKNSPGSFNLVAVKKVLEDMGTTLLKDESNLQSKNPNVLLINWSRIIVDEFHEIYTVSKHCHMMNLLQLFKGHYKWCVTGTPFEKNENCMIKMVDFITNYANDYGNKIFLNQDIVYHLTNNCFRRNTKKSVKEEFELPPIEEEIVWLKFSATERMMYNAYLANPNNDKFSIFLRQLCCHPQLAQETKDALANCKTLADIEKMMVAHYKTSMDSSYKKYRNMMKRIRLVKKKITKIEKRQKKAQLKKAGYEVSSSESESESDESDMSDIELDDDDEEVGNNIKNVYSDDEYDEIEVKASAPKKLIKISKENEDDILKMILMGGGGNQSTITLDNLRASLGELETRLAVLKKDYDGKRTTYAFYKNVVDRIRKTAVQDDGSESDTESECDEHVEDDGTQIMNVLDKQVNSQNKNKNDSDSDSDSGSDEDEETCGICLCEISENDIGVTKCGHLFHYQCIKTVITQRHQCPYCRKAVRDDEVFMISYEIKKKKEIKKNKEQKNKEELINEYGTKLANLICYLKSTDKHRILFSQWDSLLRKVGKIMSDNGIKNVFCRGNVYQRDKALREFEQDDKIKVIMLSSESAASGTNLTKATEVILLDPVYGNYEYRKNTEWQAIGRAHRLGQKHRVKVVRFVIKDTIEEEIYNANKEEDKDKKQHIKIFETSDDTIILNKKQTENENNSDDISDTEHDENEEVMTVKPPKKTIKKAKKTICDDDI